MKQILQGICGALILFSSYTLSAQNDRFFHSVGSLVFSEYTKTPAFSFNSTATVYNNQTGNYENVDVPRYGRYSGLTYGGFLYNFRANIMQFSDEMAIGINLQPQISFSILKFAYTTYPDDSYTETKPKGMVHVLIPIYLSMEFGAGSTYKSAANQGGNIGIGIDYFKGPFVDGGFSDESPLKKIGTSYVEPIVYCSYRFWDAKNKVSELGLKLGFGPSADFQATSTDPVEKSGAFSIRLSWVRLLNY